MVYLSIFCAAAFIVSLYIVLPITLLLYCCLCCSFCSVAWLTTWISRWSTRRRNRDQIPPPIPLSPHNQTSAATRFNPEKTDVRHYSFFLQLCLFFSLHLQSHTEDIPPPYEQFANTPPNLTTTGGETADTVGL